VTGASADVYVSGAVEGIVDEAVFRRLVRESEGHTGPVYRKNGKGALLSRLPGYNHAARFGPWFVLLDLDRDADCAPPFRDRWLGHPEPRMCFRIAVRSVEAWLMADGARMAQFLRVQPSLLPSAPDALSHPKQALIELVRQSPMRDLRADMLPRPGSGRVVGPAYSSRLIEFVEARWRPETAERRSDSLRRCVLRLKQLVEATRLRLS